MSSRLRTAGSALLLLVCLLANAVACGDELTGPVDKETVLKLLPKGVDGLDPKDVAAHKKLVSLGERAYPALAEILQGQGDPTTVSRILAAFLQSDGDKAVPRRAIGNLLSSATNTKILKLCAGALREIGTKEDARFLLPLLNHDDEFVRANAARALGQIGDESVAEEMKSVVNERAKQLAPEVAANDYSLRDMREAIGRIDQRAAEKRGSAAVQGAPRRATEKDSTEKKGKQEVDKSRMWGVVPLLAVVGLGAFITLIVLRRRR